MSRSERLTILALLGLALAGQGVRLLLDRRTAPGESFLLPSQRPDALAGHRAASHVAGRPLQPGERLDPDRASAAELARLPGVGMRLAKEIVADRELRGSFGSPGGLLRVDGIGPATLSRLEPFLRFQRLGPDRAAQANINAMTQAELERLPGVGPARARAILAYRDRNGPFADPQELDRVPGLGRGLARRLAGLVTVR